MNKKVKILLSSVCTVLFLSAACYYLIPGQTISTSASFVSYKNADALDVASDLVVIGTIKTDLSDDEPFIIKDSTNKVMLDFGTTTQLSVEKVLKGNDTVKHVAIIQPIAYIRNPVKNQPDLFTTEDYEPLQKNTKYLLFLKKSPTRDAFSITGLCQGRINLDRSDSYIDKVSIQKPDIKNVQLGLRDKYFK